MPPRSSHHAADDTESRMEASEDIPNMILSLTQQMRKMQSDHAAEIASLRSSLSSQIPLARSHSSPSAYDKFISDPQKFASRCLTLKHDVEDSNSLLSVLANRDLCPVIHFLNATLPKDFMMTLGVTSSPPNPLALFRAIQARFSPGNCFQKLSLICDWSDILVASALDENSLISERITSWRKIFSLKKRLNIQDDELEGLFLQLTCSPPDSLNAASFDQLVLSTIIASSDPAPSAAFVAQVITNSAVKIERGGRYTSPIINCFSEVQHTPSPTSRPSSSFPVSETRRPPDHLLDKFGAQCFYCGELGHWRADCPKRHRSSSGSRPITPQGFRPKTPDYRPSTPSAFRTSRNVGARVSQVSFIKENSSEKVLADSGASTHLTGATKFVTAWMNVPPFNIMLADSKTTITIHQIVNLKIPIPGGWLNISDVPFSSEILGTVLSLGLLVRTGVLPVFEGVSLFLYLRDVTIPTLFDNNVWWVKTRNPALNTSVMKINVALSLYPNLSPLQWHRRLGHACDKTVKEFLKINVPDFDLKSWSSFYCDICAKAKSTHGQSKTQTEIPKNLPLDLLVSDILGPFEVDKDGFRYLLTLRDHATTYSFVAPMHSRSDVLLYLKDWISLIHVQCHRYPKTIRTDNAKEFVSSLFSQFLASKGIILAPSLPYSPSENGEAERLNRTLGDMARSMLLESNLPNCFWRYAYLMAAFIHNRIPNSRRGDKSPFECLFNRTPALKMIYPFGAKALVHIPHSQQNSKLHPRALECYLLNVLPGSAGWLLWDITGKQTIQSNSVTFPDFNLPPQNTPDKGHLQHILNVALGEFPTDEISSIQEHTIVTLPTPQDFVIPSNFKNAMKSSFRAEWHCACLDKLNQLKKRDVFVLVDKPKDAKVIGHQWVFNLKRNLAGEIQKFKARFCARGDSQRPGIDCGETYAPTASLLCLRLLLTVSKFYKCSIASFDVSGAYLFSPIDEEIYVSPPVEIDSSLSGKSFLLKKALYGIRQAGRCWWKFFSDLLHNLGFIASEIEQSFYLFKKGDVIIAIWIHVDDGLVASNLVLALSSFSKSLKTKLEIKWFPTIDKIVGINVLSNEHDIQLSQPVLIQGILNAYSRPIIKREANMSTSDYLNDDDANTPPINPTEFRSFIGSLSYIVAGTRPDLAFAVKNLARHSTHPVNNHWLALDHLMGYLWRTQNYYLSLNPRSLNIDLWTDAGWGGSLERSHSGCVIKLGNSPIFWNSKKQTIVALSTCAAEYVALSDATQHFVQTINHMKHFADSFEKKILCDNEAAIGISKDALSRKRTRYLNRAFFFVNNTIRQFNITVKWVPTSLQQANIFTKRLSGPSTKAARELLCLRE
ncbi:hypothetical protein O181_006222 [Austropuccinia psidii MF-1]|uniref:Integrase catalytic domain-containing protein n=1 Tax=Austropuccinia psidii MF-1 TaxID=1389203 RepID=A0A9Q3BJN0_9BASI|nr:hypothetical protein [Austropuccinia psidii MF-1]